jgi:hypothetical protein
VILSSVLARLTGILHDETFETARQTGQNIRDDPRDFLPIWTARMAPRILNLFETFFEFLRLYL